jgi:response regulator RpfG family c-di-GMP phosphodiesterase
MIRDSYNNPLIAEIESVRANFLVMTEKLVKDVQRHDKIMLRSDKRQKQEYDELQARLIEVESLQQEIEDTQKEVIFTLGAIAEARSQETGNHVRRVAEYSRILAVHYGLSPREAEMLKQASPMHDIGKLATPDSILNKPGKLTIEEFSIMKQHAELGYEMLKHSARPLIKMAATIAYEHHEKYDGSGYPRGIVGKNIHIYGRITAVADVFDALGSKRCYKEAWPDDQIFALFRDQRGKHFDPNLVDLFFGHLEELLVVRDEFKDVAE